jgi:hypothetical protein
LIACSGLILTVAQIVKYLAPVVPGHIVKIIFNTQELIVFADAIGAA